MPLKKNVLKLSNVKNIKSTLVGGRRLKKNYRNVLELSKIAYRLGLRKSRLDCPLTKYNHILLTPRCLFSS